MSYQILYEDNHLLVVEKPVNMPVQEDRSQDLDLLSLAKEDIKTRYQKPGNVYLALLHRLDRPVGGAIVFAKTSKAASRMADLFRRREVERRYLAVVRGKVVQKKGTLVNYLWKDRKKNIVYAVEAGAKGAKRAVLHYRLLAHSKDLSLLEVTLETGRPHQIRVQLKEMGHPLYGDQKYGTSLNQRGEQLALWSYKLSFIHPVRKKKLSVISLPPRRFPWEKWDIATLVKEHQKRG